MWQQVKASAHIWERVSVGLDNRSQVNHLVLLREFECGHEGSGQLETEVGTNLKIQPKGCAKGFEVCSPLRIPLRHCQNSDSERLCSALDSGISTFYAFLFPCQPEKQVPLFPGEAPRF